MKKQDFIDFKNAKLDAKLAPLNEEIMSEKNAYANEIIEKIDLRKMVKLVITTDKKFSDYRMMQRELDPKLIGYLDGTYGDTGRALIGFRVDKDSDLNDVVDKIKDYIMEYKFVASDRVIELRKQINNIKNEYSKIHNNLNAIRSPKKKVEWLVSLGFDEKEIYSYDTSENLPMLASVDKELI